MTSVREMIDFLLPIRVRGALSLQECVAVSCLLVRSVEAGTGISFDVASRAALWAEVLSEITLKFGVTH